MTASEAGVDLALIQTSLLFSSKCKLVSIRTSWLIQQKQWGLHQTMVTSSLAAIQRPGHWTDDCKMVYYQLVLLSFFRLMYVPDDLLPKLFQPLGHAISISSVNYRHLFVNKITNCPSLLCLLSRNLPSAWTTSLFPSHFLSWPRPTKATFERILTIFCR